MKLATLAGGCFWCTEAIFKRLKGVKSVVPGYAGGNMKNPTYEEVSAGDTGHAEAIQIEFDEREISYEMLLDVFFSTHDPTTFDRQGNDVGSQYRSIIFYQDVKQKKIAEKAIKKLRDEKVYMSQIVTEIVPATSFYEAENYHKDYFERNKDKKYCSVVISPKIQKLLKKYKSDVKEEYREN